MVQHRSRTSTRWVGRHRARGMTARREDPGATLKGPVAEPGKSGHWHQCQLRNDLATRSGCHPESGGTQQSTATPAGLSNVGLVDQHWTRPPPLPSVTHCLWGRSRVLPTVEGPGRAPGARVEAGIATYASRRTHVTSGIPAPNAQAVFSQENICKAPVPGKPPRQRPEGRRGKVQMEETGQLQAVWSGQRHH